MDERERGGGRGADSGEREGAGAAGRGGGGAPEISFVSWRMCDSGGVATNFGFDSGESREISETSRMITSEYVEANVGEAS